MNQRTLRKIALAAALVYTILQPEGLSFNAYFIPLLILGGLFLSSGKVGWGLYSLLLLFLFSSFTVYIYSSRLFIPFPPDHCVLVRGRLIQEPSWNSRGNLNFTLDLTESENREGAAAESRGRLAVSLPADRAFNPESWIRGDSLTVTGKMVFFDDSPFFFGTSMNGYMIDRPHHFRRRILSRVHHKAQAVSEFSASLLPALVLGLKDPSQQKSARLFRETGTAHIIALSGFHSGLVALLLYAFFKIITGYRGALIMAGLGLLFYLYLAGLKPSLFRSVLMYQIILLCKLNHRKADLKIVLLASYLISALIQPESLHTLSARLSYLALWGILYSAPHIYSLLLPLGSRFLRGGLSASLAAQIWTFPLVLNCFSIWYPGGILASLVLTPLVSAYMVTGIFYLITPNIKIVTVPAGSLCRLLETLLLLCAGFFSRIPSISFADTGSGLFLILLFPLLLGFVYRPGGFGGKRKSGPELRLYLRDQGVAGFDGTGSQKTMGPELSGEQRCTGENC